MIFIQLSYFLILHGGMCKLLETCACRTSWTGFSDGYCSMPVLFIQRFTMVSHFSMCSCPHQREYKTISFSMPTAMSSLTVQRSVTYKLFGLQRWQPVRFRSNALVTLDTDDNVARFSLKEPSARPRAQTKGMKKPHTGTLIGNYINYDLLWHTAPKPCPTRTPDTRLDRTMLS